MGRKPLEYEATKLVFQVPKALKEKLKLIIKPIIKKEVKKFKK